jgi:hypothetical protein
MGSRHLIIAKVASHDWVCMRMSLGSRTAKARIFRGAKRRDWHIASFWAVHDDVCDWG